MNVLKEAIESLNKDELKVLKLLLGRTNKDLHRKDIFLLDKIRRQGDSYNEEKTFQKLYPDLNKSAFYSLKNKLLNDLIKTLIFINVDNNQKLRCVQLLFTSKILIEKNKHELGSYFLDKAKKLAESNEYYDLLELIIKEKIGLSRYDLSINPEELIQERKVLEKKIQQTNTIDDLLSIVHYRIRVSCNHASKSRELQEELQKTINGYTNDPELKSRPSLRFRLYNVVCGLLLENHNYRDLASFIEKTIDQFTEEKLFSKDYHEQKLQMISYLINCYFFLGEFEKCLKVADLLEKEMNAYNGFLYKKFFLYLCNARFMAYSEIDETLAIQKLKEWEKHPDVQKSSHYPLFIFFNLCLLYFERKEFGHSIKNINNLFHHPAYKNYSPDLKFKLRLTELIIRYEIGDLDFLELRIKQFNKDFPIKPEDNSFERERTFLQILTDMAKTQFWKENKAIANKVESFLQFPKSEETNREFINYDDWLKKKVK